MQDVGVAPIGTHPDLPRDDLRAYAYEGDGSSSGSLTSTISGRHTFLSVFFKL